jgi:hypothetical protein
LQAETLPEAYDSALQKAIFEYLCTLVSAHKKVKVEELEQKDIGKAQRDGKLLASIAHARSAKARAAADHVIVLLSSSPRLRKADIRFRTSLGEPQAVMSLGTLSYLLSMIPEIGLGAGALRRALFDFGETGRLPDTERLALRVIRATGNFDIPWARRRTLQTHLEANLHKEARQRGVRLSQVREDFEGGKDTARSAQLILEAVRSIAFTDKTSEELGEAKRTIAELETDVHRLELLLKKTSRPPKGKGPEQSP